jgi:hypothetical protein
VAPLDVTFRVGACLDVFGAEPDASFDAFVCDWPAGVTFMSRAWDRDHGGREAWVKVWAEVARLMRQKAKPGAYALVWALPRTSHWTACALEDGGWFVQDVLTHVFGQGWPKGRSALKPASEHWILARNGSGGALQIDAARVPRGESGAMNSAGRTATGEMLAGSWPPNFLLSHCPDCEERGTRRVKGGAAQEERGRRPGGFGDVGAERGDSRPCRPTYGDAEFSAFDCLAVCDCGLSLLAPAGGDPPRCACGLAMWWACPVAEMDRQSGDCPTGKPTEGAERTTGIVYGEHNRRSLVGGGGYGGASRFFPHFAYQAKAAGGERHAGCDELYWRADKRSPFGFVRVSREEWGRLGGSEGTAWSAGASNEGGADKRPGRAGAQAFARGNVHPTVKSLALMEHLCALVVPPGGRLGDVTCGSGGTGIALGRLNLSRGLGASFLGSDICPEAVEIAQARLRWWQANTAVQGGLFGDSTVIEPEAKKPGARGHKRKGSKMTASEQLLLDEAAK